MTERVGVRELRQHASRYLALVKAGETVEVTERGVLIAVLAPPNGPRSIREQLIVTGRLKPATSPTGRLRAARAMPISDGGPSNQELLDAEREERL